MTIQELKQQIQNKKVTDQLIILKDTENNFISNSYIQAISKTKKLPVEYVDDIAELIADKSSIFGFADTDTGSALKVIKKEVYEWANPKVTKLTNVIIVVSKFADKKVEKELSDYVVVVPKLDDWQIKDYVYSVAEGVAEKDLDWLINLCGKNYLRLRQELNKLSLFTPDEQKYLFQELIRDGAVDDLSQYSIFNFTNAITSKDYTNLARVYREIDRVDINEFGLLVILLKNFKNMLMVQMTPNPTPENTGIEAKQLWAVKKMPRVYSPEQLIKIFEFLSDIDRQVKSGELPTDIMIDYMVIKILSM